MNAQKFVKENKLQNIELEIGGKRESILSILERFQQPIFDKVVELADKVVATKRVIDTQPMSPMSEMEYKRVIAESKKTMSILENL